MKHSPFHIDENELDLLLRQMTLDERADEFTQNSLVMNAEIIFHEGNPSGSFMTAAREQEMIAKLEDAFVRRKGFGRFWLNGIVFVFLIAVAVWIYKTNSGNITSPSPLPENHINNFIPAAGKDTAGEKTIAPEKTVLNANYIPGADSFSSSEDTAMHFNPAVKKEHFVTPDTHIPVEPYWYEGNYVVNDIPGPVFSAKASPENYKTASGVFYPGEESIMFSCKQDSFSASYYTGTPFKSGMNDMRYFNLGEYAQTAQKEMKAKDLHIQTTLYPWFLPWSIMEYADTNEMKVETVRREFNGKKHTFDWMFMYKIPEKGIRLAMEPFYFRKTEISNKEYREFTEWVRASNGYADKPIKITKLDTVEIKDPKDSSQGIMLRGKKFKIIPRLIWTEDYKEVYNYNFFNTNSEAVKALGKSSIYVYPDTLSWVNDFSFSYNEPMTNMYFWHPAYDNYPVVGVSWYQAMAFLDWKTHMHQKQLDAEGVPYEIEYTLPSDIEWELASISMQQEKNMVFAANMECTDDWLTNLGIRHPQDTDNPNLRTNYLKNLFTKDQYFRGDFIADGYFHTGPADLTDKKNKNNSGTLHVDPLGISWMDGNVSEWMMESYATNWKPFFDKHLAVLAMDTSESTKLARQIEMLYDKGNAANGRLVRGSNWYDERFGGKPGSGRNEAGISPKRFVNPSEQHSTIGFRYVVHVKRK